MGKNLKIGSISLPGPKYMVFTKAVLDPSNKDAAIGFINQ